jgi:uncharacterized membrane protein
VTAAILIPVLIGLLAFAIDCGHLLRKRADLQRAADDAALAAVRDLIPNAQGYQDFAAVRETAQQYADENITDVEGFVVLDTDIELGRYDPETICNQVTLLNDGVYDAVHLTLRYDTSANGKVPLYFAGIFGLGESEVSATATSILQSRPRGMKRGKCCHKSRAVVAEGLVVPRYRVDRESFPFR